MDLENPPHQITHSSVTTFTVNIPDDLAVIKNPWFIRCHFRFSCAMPLDVLIVPHEEWSDDKNEDGGLDQLIPSPRAAWVFDDNRLSLKWPSWSSEVITHTQSSPHTVMASLPLQQQLTSRDVHEIKNLEGALGFDPWRNQYVISRLFYRSYMVLEDEDTSEQSFEGDNWHEGLGHSWKITDNLTYAIKPATQPIYMRGAFYWCTDGKLNLDMILWFNLYDEKFGLAGKLCLVHTANEETFSIWQLVDDGL
uniref:F-box associated domain-containing protein n=1 Tax=Oryza punctata TaxID=4537 RepID=A0A0E0KPR8_ORYPU